MMAVKERPDGIGAPPMVAGPIYLNDYYEKRVDAERRLTRLESEQASTAEALKLQRTETDRRLTDLNNENARIREFQNSVPSVDAFNALNSRVKLLEDRQSEYAGRRETQTEAKGQGNIDRSVVVAIILAVAGVIATFLATHH